MTPEEKARKIIDGKLEQSGWVIQDLAMVNPMASLCLGNIPRDEWKGR